MGLRGHTLSTASISLQATADLFALPVHEALLTCITSGIALPHNGLGQMRTLLKPGSPGGAAVRDMAAFTM